MAFADTITIKTEDGTAGDVILYRQGVNNAADLGKFVSDNGVYTLEVRQKRTRNRKRHEFVVTLKKITADALTAVNTEVSCSAGFYLDEPNAGFDGTEKYNLMRVFSPMLVGGTYFTPLVRGDT